MGSGSGVIDFWRRQRLWCVSEPGVRRAGSGAREPIDRKPAFQIESRKHNCSDPALGAVPDGGGLLIGPSGARARRDARGQWPSARVIHKMCTFRRFRESRRNGSGGGAAR